MKEITDIKSLCTSELVIIAAQVVKHTKRVIKTSKAYLAYGTLD